MSVLSLARGCRSSFKTLSTPVSSLPTLLTLILLLFVSENLFISVGGEVNFNTAASNIASNTTTSSNTSLMNLFENVDVAFESETQFKTRILTNYRRDVLPPSEPANVTTVMIGMAIRAITDIDQLESTLTANVWFRQKWYDPRLAWNRTKEFPKHTVSFSTDPSLAESIWVPDFWLYNTGEKPMKNLEFSNANVYPSGLVIWSR